MIPAPKFKDRQPFSLVRKLVNTGDIVLFSGKGAVARLIQLGTHSPWSHVGMVVRTDQGVMLWESTPMTNVVDVEQGKPVGGVQLVSLTDRIKWFDGTVAVRILVPGLRDDLQIILNQLRDELRGRPYEKSRVALVRAAIDAGRISENPPDLSSLFCSELVAEAYHRLDLMEFWPPASEFTPADFSSASTLPLVGNYSLTPNIEVIRD